MSWGSGVGLWVAGWRGLLGLEVEVELDCPHTPHHHLPMPPARHPAPAFSGE